MTAKTIRWLLPACALFVALGVQYSFAQSPPQELEVTRNGPLPSEMLAKSSLDIELLEGGFTVRPQNLLWASRDLNGDGVMEVIVAIVDPAFTAGGSDGFEHRIYTYIDEDAIRILAVNGNDFQTDCSSRNEGFCDLIVDDVARLRYEPGGYVAIRQ